MPELMTKQDAIEYLLYMKHDVQAKSPMDIALDTAIEVLKQPTIEPKRGEWSRDHFALSAGIAALYELESSHTVNRWISVEDALPEKDTDVIVCCYGSDMIPVHDGETIQDAVGRTRRECVSVTVGFIGSDGWYGADWFPMMVTPTYWMPLPEPPKEEV